MPAGDLKPGHALNTDRNAHGTVLSVHSTRGEASRDNLTVAGLHTYYVVAGATPVLVHNSCGPDSGPVFTPEDVVNRAKQYHGVDGVYLYRGITNPHVHRDEALQGISQPRGGHDDPTRHQGADMNSIFTSWTPDLETAQEFAKDGEEYDRDLLILRKPFSDFDPADMTVAGKRGLDELEILVRDTVTGCEISCNYGPFGPPGSK